MEKKDRKDNKSMMKKYYTFLMYMVVIILINAVGVTLFFRIDLTSNNLYSLSDASKKAVSTLKEPLTINVFFSQNLPAPYNNIERYLHDLMEEYAIHAGNQLSYRFYNVNAKEGDLTDEAEGNRKIAQSFGIHPVNVQKIDQDEAKVQRAYMGMVLIHGDVVEKIPAITSTDGLEYKITSAIKKMNNKISALLDLPEKIKIKLIISSSIHQISGIIDLKGLDVLKAGVTQIVAKLQDKTYGQLEFVFVDPTTEKIPESEIAKYQRFGLEWPAGKAPNGQEIQAGKAIVALGIEFKEKSLERQLLNRGMNLTNRGLEEKYTVLETAEIETFINDNIDTLIDINEDLGYLSSHGTLELKPNLPPQMQMMETARPDALKKLNTLLSKEYTVKPVDLKKEGIPESIDTLIIAGAKDNFSDWELLQIDQFLMKGKSLAVFVDSFREIQQQQQRQMFNNFQQPIYLPLNTGLEKLLGHYGLSVGKSYVLDESCFISRGREQGEMPFYFVPIIKNENINHEFDFMKNIKELIALKASPVEINSEKIKQNKTKATRLLASTSKSWEMKGKINLMPMMISPPTDDKERGSRSLSYLVEGQFPSYFEGKAIPEKPREDEKKEEGSEAAGQTEAKPEPKVKESLVKRDAEILTQGKPGKIFIIGTSEILKDNMLDEEAQSPNSLFLLNTLDYLNNKEEVAVMRGKNQRFNPIKDTKPFTRFLIKGLNIAGLPIMFILLGVFIWIRRKTRRKTIQMMFEK